MINTLIMGIAYYFESIRESYWFIVKNKWDNHTETFALRVIMITLSALACIVIDQRALQGWAFVEQFVNYVMRGIAIHFCLFNFSLNLIRKYIGKQKWISLFHLSTTSVIDQWLERWAPVIGGGFILIITLWLYKPSLRTSRKAGILICQAFVLAIAISMNLKHWLV